MNSTEKSKQLQERLIEFCLNIIRLTKSLPQSTENKIVSNQIIRSSSSIGANYTEAIFSYSKPDFIHNINISKKETGETLYWLELINRTNNNKSNQIDKLKTESQELLRIFISIVKTSQSNHSKK